MRILVRTSRWAIWSRRFAAFALPVLVLSALMHRERLLDSSLFNALLGFSLVVAALAIVTGFAALIRIWSTGDHGWRRALFGIFVGLLAFSPAILGTYAYLRYPRIADFVTPPGPPPTLIDGRAYRAPTPEIAARLALAFPLATQRTYPLDLAGLFELVRTKANRNGWEIRRETRPTASATQASLNALATTWLGWRDEVAIVLVAGERGTTLTMRSAALAAVEHDLGQNGRRVEAFLQELDADIATRNLQAAPAEETEEAPPVQVEGDEPAPQGPGAS